MENITTETPIGNEDLQQKFKLIEKILGDDPHIHLAFAKYMYKKACEEARALQSLIDEMEAL